MAIGSREVLLNGRWQLRHEPLSCGPDQADRIAELPDGWIDTPVPGDVRQGLIAAGLLAEPLVGLNSFQAHWIERRSWWFRKTFRATRAMLWADVVELELDGLDVHASVFLNGAHLGDHPSAFRPFVARVQDRLVAGPNMLLVRLTNGLEKVRPEQADELGGHIATEADRGRPERGDRRRVFLRKPQYSWGWDWAPRTATVAIAGDVKLRVLNVAALRDVHVRAARCGKHVDLHVAVAVEWFDFQASGAGTVRLRVRDPDGKPVATARTEALLQSGWNYLDLPVRIRNARLWWPAGMGPQDRYTIELELQVDGRTLDARSLRYGIRFVELLTDRTFALRVNGVTMFCKGANWIPADAVYARATDAKVDRLVVEAKNANFNMLRVWGGGLYEREAFYEACDREGILVWQDFMLSCAPYPDHLESFRDELAKEADYQTRRLRNHACIALWCGSNECLYCMSTFVDRKTDRGARLLGQVLPQVVRRNCPDVPYWYESPYGGDVPDSWQAGDCHYWRLMMNPDMAKRIRPELYDECGALFVSEFGYPGPCCEQTTRAYLDGAPFMRTDKVWQHHNNTFERQTVDAGIAKHYADPAGLSPKQYLLYGGLTQGWMLGYALEALRAKAACHGALFWMYNDCWGEVGWSIIDYYLRRKISWYFVRRAFAPRRLILRARGGRIVVILANDTRQPVRGTVEYGYVSLDGRVRQSKRSRFTAAPAARTVLVRFAPGGQDRTGGVWYARIPNHPDILPATFKAADFRQLRIGPANFAIEVAPAGARRYHVSITSDVYAHAVHLRLPARAVPEDDYFDLLPGERRTVLVDSPRPLSRRNVSATSVAAGGSGPGRAR